MIRRIKACLNGGRLDGEHPAVPVTAEQLAAAAQAAVVAGAEAVHMHPRGPDGVETLGASDIGAAVAAVRAACPGTPVGVSTGLWITGGDVARRLQLVTSWAELPAAAKPDFASVNVGEQGFADLVAALGPAGIDVEAGVWSLADVAKLAESGVAVLRVLVEIVGAAVFDAIGAADAILGELDEARVNGPRLLHGEGDACWPLIAHSGRLGLATRVGLEDTLVNPDGSPAIDNADLIRRALALRAQPLQ
ncbi:MAG: hypothetical protein QOC94_252 [Actinoplanes sp.]|jgi:uncharacterized protein (DUF849 family)|nr:hypothetical protein [Actinoplanes sp.]